MITHNSQSMFNIEDKMDLLVKAKKKLFSFQILKTYRSPYIQLQHSAEQFGTDKGTQFEQFPNIEQ